MNVMKAAWTIARIGANTFGGSPKEYFVEALKQAWRNIKAAARRAEFRLAADTRRFRTWIAEIVGKHPVYKFERNFLREDDTDEYGYKEFVLNEGVYEWNNGNRRQFIQVANGKIIEIDASDVMDTLVKIGKVQFA